MNLQNLYDYIFHQQLDGGGLSMKTVGLLLGAALVGGHLLVWLRAADAMAIAKEFPRGRAWGIVLLAVCLVWTQFLVAFMDMGEFYTWRRTLMIILPVAFVLVVVFVPEFLAVRALGTLLLLVASPVLHSAFLQPQTSRLLLPILAYAWIVVGMFIVGMPYLMRDAITWLTEKPQRWNAAALSGAAYGAVLFVVALLTY
ncbi:MAG: hypothetical protein ACOYMN_10430 [Roseimicrobium sp.]